MQVRVAPHLDACATGPLTVAEFLARFPEVPNDLADAPVFADYVAAFGPLLRRARKPTPCMGKDGGDAEHQFYAKLVNDLAIYGLGLARRERTLTRLAATLEQYRQAPATFACGLVPARPRGAPRTGCA
jgi:hypothetical protein